MIMVTHDPDMAARVGRTLLVSDGEIVEERLNELDRGARRGSELATVICLPAGARSFGT